MQINMLNKKFIFSVMLLLGITVSELNPQNTLNLKEKSGALTSFALSNINKLTFDSGNITVNKKDGTTSAFTLTNIRYLNFSNATSIVNMIDNEKKLKLYPNPAIDQLNVQFESLTTEETKIQIIDMQGMLVYQQSFSSQAGLNYLTIPVVILKSGLYLCRLQNGNKLEICKFIKR